MAHPPTNHDETPIRLFKSDFMEFFTHINPVAVIIIWLPVVAAMLILPSGAKPTPVGILAGGWAVGLFLWTLAEYLLHRFVFHFRPKTPRMERITFLFHGVHHAQPQCKTRLVMPPVVSIPLASLFYGAFWLIAGNLFHSPAWVNPLMAGFITGYLAYDLTHYATHHFAMRSGYAKYIKRYHIMHHYKNPDGLYGVSSPIWDYVFRTNP
jgi:sterol desaturase/sphingolipid hydroxylase (fatty acid hydroxylase superfamily)